MERRYFIHTFHLVAEWRSTAVQAGDEGAIAEAADDDTTNRPVWPG